MPISVFLFFAVGLAVLLGFFGFMRQLPPMIRRAVPLALIVIGGADYLYEEFVFNKGPDDYGAAIHAQEALIKQRPTAYWRVIKFAGFVKDPTNPNAGTYRYSYSISGETGMINCHYDRGLGGFDHDNIVPDK